MGDWNPLISTRMVDDDQTASPWHATVTASGSNNTKGSYTQLVASLAVDCIGFILCYNFTQSAYVLVDIAVGAGGSEQVVIPNLGLSNGSQTGGSVSSRVFIPLAIPAGTRVAMRSQASTGGLTGTVKATFIADTYTAFRPPQRYEDWGAVTGSSFGTAVTAGNAAKGSYVQLIASTGLTTKWVILEAESVTASAGQITIDLATGGAGSEQVVAPDIFTDNLPLGTFIAFPLHIAQGSRVAARCAAASGTPSVKIHAHGGG